jgi:hypothetical protein
MTFGEMKTELDSRIEAFGLSQGSQAPDLGDLINRSYRDLCLDTECIRGPHITGASVASTEEYNAKTMAGDGRSWKYFTAIYYDGKQLKETDESELGARAYNWLLEPDGTPIAWFSPRPDVFVLWPTPDAIKTILVYGVREPAPLSASSDVPVVIPKYQEAIIDRAAAYWLRRWAKDEAIMAAVRESEARYTKAIKSYKAERLNQTVSIARPTRRVFEPGRI